jgi:hypothetical protein
VLLYRVVCPHSHQAALSTDPIPTIGLRRPLGSDVRRRRYWVLGGGAGAWRVYCEEGDSSNWVSGAVLHACTPSCAQACAPYRGSFCVPGAEGMEGLTQCCVLNCRHINHPLTCTP